VKRVVTGRELYPLYMGGVERIRDVRTDHPTPTNSETGDGERLSTPAPGPISGIKCHKVDNPGISWMLMTETMLGTQRGYPLVLRLFLLKTVKKRG